MTLSNSNTATLIATVKASGSLDNAKVAFAKRIAEMAETGWTAAAFDSKADEIDLIRDTIAQAVFNKSDYATWADTSLARKVKQGDKHVTSKRGKLVDLVDKRIRDIKKALVTLEATPAGKAKGANANAPRALDQRIKDELAKLRNAINKDATAEPPVLETTQREEILAAFTRVTDLLAKH